MQYVYILSEPYDYEPDLIFGAFSSEEAASEYAFQHLRINPALKRATDEELRYQASWRYHIEKVEVVG